MGSRAKILAGIAKRCSLCEPIQRSISSTAINEKSVIAIGQTIVPEKIQMGINPQVLVADNGYMDDNVIKYAYENNIRLLIPDRAESSKSKPKNKEKPFAKPNFTYDWKTDSFICPMGEQLLYKNDRKLNGEWMRVYSTNKCKTCPVKNQCTKSRVKEIFEPVDDLR